MGATHSFSSAKGSKGGAATMANGSHSSNSMPPRAGWRRCAMESREPQPRCVFCDIVKTADDPGSRVVYQSPRVVAFKDIRPAAATHLLVIPKEHIVNTASLRPAEDLELVREMHEVGRQLLRQRRKGEQGGGATAASAGDGDEEGTKFGYHIPPFNSVNHLHLHCFELPHQPAWKGLKYMFPCNWITAGELESVMQRAAGSSTSSTATAAGSTISGARVGGVGPARGTGGQVERAAVTAGVGVTAGGNGGVTAGGSVTEPLLKGEDNAV